MEIYVDGSPLDITGDLSVSIEERSPLFNDIGSQSISATLPVTGRNMELLGAPHRPDAGAEKFRKVPVEIRDGIYRRTGLMNVTEASRREGITFNIGFDNSIAYSQWQSCRLSELKDLPVFSPGQVPGLTRLESLLAELYRLYRGQGIPELKDLGIFPLAIGKSEKGSSIYWEILNAPREHMETDHLSDPERIKDILKGPSKVMRLLKDVPTSVTVPEGYMVSPFLKAWRILEFIFNHLGLYIERNPFLDDPCLETLVVLNNAADSICLGEIRYAELMPDCTVEEFLGALWTRFGLVYRIDYDKRTVALDLLRDTLKKIPRVDLDTYLSDWPAITYENPTYLCLKCRTSLEGAEPATERWEDFARGLSTEVLKGAEVGKWTYSGEDDHDDWNGADWEYGYDPDPDYPEPPDPDDDRDYYSMPARMRAAAAPSYYLAREYITWKWFKLDSSNGKAVETSTPFFTWDPQPEGLESLEISSADEAVPIELVISRNLGTGNDIGGYMPVYLAGSRHYHSYITSSDENEGQETPLAFMFCLKDGQSCVGRICGERDGVRQPPMWVNTPQGPVDFRYSLLFQFKGGLYDLFWRRYDELLRHAARSVEVPLRIPKHVLLSMDMLEPVEFAGLPYLIDRLEYAIPSDEMVPVTATLRPLTTQGSYDFRQEVSLQDFGRSG